MRHFLLLSGLAMAVAAGGCKSDHKPAPPVSQRVTPLPAPKPAPALDEPKGVVRIPTLDEPKPPVPVPEPEPPSSFQVDKLKAIDEAIEAAIADKKLPGGVLWVERNGERYVNAYGQRALVPATETMSVDTIFDAASLTKVVACTPAVMLLVERNLIDLEDKVAKYIPDFAQNGKDSITIRQLMTHTSGLRPDIGLKPDWEGYDAAIQLVCKEKLSSQPGEKFIYSDSGPIILGELVRLITGQSLDRFVAREVYGPLKMIDTGFNPPQLKLPRIAPTEVVDGKPFRGVVHDPRSRRMGGVAGHAGLFTTAADLSRYARMMLNGGELDGVRIFKPETIKLMTSVQTPPNISAQRGLGWDINSGYASLRGSVFPVGGYGHTGWTGTSIWIDPASQTIVTFLSNRNHPTEAGSVVALRKVIGTLAAEAVNATPLPATVYNGIDVLKLENYKTLKDLRIGLITNHTGRDREGNPTIDTLHQAPGVQLKALFSPEHGIRGTLDQSKISDSVDEKTGLPVFSLYGETRKPKPEHLKDLDALVFDIQDIGCRFYTYVGTMLNCMEAAGEAGIKFIVLDRLNPINGVQVDGPVLAAKTSFVAWHPVAVRHGMTVGELARLFHAEKNLELHLIIVPVAGWKRDLWFDECSLPWVNPSPNMRNLTEATLYPGVGLLETTSVSVGRGTATPFEVVGAPYIDGEKFAKELNAAKLPGVRFEATRYTPDASVFKDKECGGVRITVTDRQALQACDVGITMALTLWRLYPDDWTIDKFDRLLGHPATVQAIRDGKSLAEIHKLWDSDAKTFETRRAGVVIYK